MFLQYIHFLRAIAIFFIVAGHTIDVYSWPDDSHLERLLRICFSNGTVLFVFIAGFLFQHLAGKYENGKYAASKFRNVLVPYLLTSLPAILAFVFFLEREGVGAEFYQYPAWQQVVLFYVSGAHLAPMWFIPMIVLYYLIAPLLVIGDSSGRLYWVIPFAVVASCLVSRGGTLQSFVHFFSVYLLGMYFSRYKERVNKVLKRKIAIGACLMLTLAFGFVELYFTSETMTRWNYLQKLALCFALLGLLLRYEHKLTSEFVRKVANCSFGVFFLHCYLLTAIKMASQYLMDKKMDGNLVSYGLLTVIVLLVSFQVVALLQTYLGRHSRMIVGS